MKIFDGIYAWDGKKHGNRDPIAWYPGAYHLKIVNLDALTAPVKNIRPFLCIFANTGQGHCIYNKPERFALHVCEDFSLHIEKVIWIEQVEKEPSMFEVVVFKRHWKIGESFLYTAQRRHPTQGELSLLSTL